MRFWLERVQQRARDVVLAGHVGKALRTVFPGQNLITHCDVRSSYGLETNIKPMADSIVPRQERVGWKIDAPLNPVAVSPCRGHQGQPSPGK